MTINKFQEYETSIFLFVIKEAKRNPENARTFSLYLIYNVIKD